MARSLAFPPRLNAAGAFVTNEQDSDDDVESGVLLALAYPQGTRVLSPGYGARPPEFETVDLDRVARSVAHSEPRAATRADLISRSLTRERIRLGFEGEAPA